MKRSERGKQGHFMYLVIAGLIKVTANLIYRRNK
ncbi:hypothetical protein C7M51_00260 [Mixta intestinalis]|uniref:Uncharacterized protein n=1 Tax=Mixta intestinalis TaxID=1615494 RepID=A0A6P1PU62_9GAMM|nr:hypothetical protein C7M51_00260 [Mixta intestinalis]